MSSSRTASKKPSYDDDFDSEVDEDSEEEEQQKKAGPPPSTTSASAAQQSKSGKSNNNKKSKGGGADSSDDSDDFSDPDDMQIPGGGLSLGTATGTREKSKGGKSLLKGVSRAPPPSAASLLNAGVKSGGGGIMPPGMAGLADDDISIVDEVKGNLPKMPTLTKAPRSALKGQNSNPMGMGLLQGFGAGSSMQGLRMPGSSSVGGLSNYSGLGGGGAAGRNPYLGSQLLAAGGGADAGLDPLAASMFSGGLSSILGSNPYSLLTGSSGSSAGGQDAFRGFLTSGGASNSSPGLYPSVSSLLSSGSKQPSGSSGSNPFQGLSQNQINSLWGMGNPMAGLAPAGGRSMFGAYGGAGGGGLMAASAAYAREQEQEDEVAAEDEDDMGVIETYSNYKPMKLEIGKAHPDPVVETASMASVEPPDVWYKLAIERESPETVDEGKLSALQLESITYASQQHEQMLRDGNRAGFLIGDGAGVGKGRTIAGIIFENYLKGRKRAIWVSVSNDLKYDAERDLKDIGAEGIDVHFLSKMKYAKINSQINNYVKKGVMYATYSALIGESQGGAQDSKYKTRLKQLLQWCGEDFDGCIIFDECHRAKNLCPSTGAGKPTKTGQTVLELQQKLPNARVVYASATGASEPKHMAYMVRLGIWGTGSPFRDFNEFLGAVEKRGVGAMEIVAMDMKLRGMYIARQLSFQGVSFRIDEVELQEDMRRMYNAAVDLWVDLMHKFEEAAALVDADKKIRKTMWGQFWSSHQRFFKYLCIASKVPHVVSVANEVIKMGKCVVIGLQSTGEARTLEVVEREEELSDFVSTAKGVLQSLVEKHFPAPDRNKIDKILGKNKSLFEELGIPEDTKVDKDGAPVLGKRKAKARAEANAKKGRYDWMTGTYGGGGDGSSDFENDNEDDQDFDSMEEDEDLDEEEEEDYNPFGADSEDEDCPWARQPKKKKNKAKNGKKKKKKNGEKNGGGGKATAGKDKVNDHVAMLLKRRSNGSNGSTLMNGGGFKHESDDVQEVKASMMGGGGGGAPVMDKVDRACQLREEIMIKIERLGKHLPANTLDQLIDELGGPTNVSEMTGRKGRVVMDEVSGDVRYESRCVGNDVPLETLNLSEKDKFMAGEKDVAVISEAASSGVSLQADRRVANQRRRVHMTLELPWSADRAIQQFGRTHRSNQVSAPEYILLISDLAGEHRFASIVAKRLESLGALTHGDRRAGESRDLSRFNIDNKYGRSALEAVFKAIMGYETPIVKPPADYKGDFFKDIADGLVGVGLITNSEDMPGTLTLDKGHNDMSKFLNRILGMHVEKQNTLFKYFADTLNAIITQAKRTGKYDQGILDVGLTEEDQVDLVRTHTFIRKHSTGKAKIELHVLQVERGLSWDASKEKWQELIGEDEGYYLSQISRNGKRTAILAVQLERNSKYKALSEEAGSGSKDKKKKKDRIYVIYRPNTGQQVKQETLGELKKKYKSVPPEEAEPHWTEQYRASAKKCSHAYWRGNCKNASLSAGRCEIGLRRKTYNVLAGSVLSVWSQVEAVLTHDGNRKGTDSRMQVVRLKLENSKRIVGTLIPNTAMTALLTALDGGSEGKEETIY